MKPLANTLSSFAILTFLSHSAIATAQTQASLDESHAVHMLYSMIALMADQNPDRARSFIETNFDIPSSQATQLIEISRNLKTASDRTNEAFKEDVCSNREYYAESKDLVIAEVRRKEVESRGLIEESIFRMEQILGAETTEKIQTWVTKELQPQVVSSNTESALRAIAQTSAVDGERLVATICR